MHRLALIALLLSFVAHRAGAQVPDTDIFVMEMPGELMEPYANAANVSDRRGYDNQPAFSHDGSSLYFTSIWDDDQADIYRIRLRSGVRQRITFTPESEYSPTPMADGSGLSVVRVEQDERQRLWRFSFDGRESELLLADVVSVGYHAWVSESVVALFLLGEPPVLVLADLAAGTRDTVATDIGRSLHRVPGREAVSFIQKGSGPWTIDLYDLETGEMVTLVTAFAGQEDYAWTPDGVILSADADVIYAWTPGADDWEQFLDLGRSDSIKSISRIAVSPRGDTIAFVAERP